MRVLITGANGFIGRKCMEIFIQEGHTVEGWVRIEQGTSACNLASISCLSRCFNAVTLSCSCFNNILLRS